MAVLYDPELWAGIQAQVPQIDALFVEFNRRVGL